MARRRGRLGLVLGAAVIAGLAALLLVLLRPAASTDTTAPAAVAEQPGPGGLPPGRAPPAVPSPPVPAPAPPWPYAADAPARAGLEGRVLSSETGEGVAGAELTFARGGAAAVARSDEGGAFRFEPPEEGRWLLAAVTAPGFLPFAPEWEHSPVAFDAAPGATIRGVEIRLAPATELVVTVLDPGGTPAAGAEVRVLGALREAALVRLDDRFTTDGSGQVRLPAPRGAVVEARKAGFHPGRAAVDLEARAARRLSVRLGEGGGAEAEPESIGGRVTGPGGSAIAGVLVTAERELRFGRAGPVERQAVTGADGAFRLGPLDPGRYRVTARADRHARAARTVDSGAEGVALELSPGARLRGCVRDGAAGTPVSTFSVLVSERRGPFARARTQGRAFFAPSGCWAMDDLAPGAASVVVAAPGYAPSGEVAVDVPESGEGVADASLAPEGRLTGVVLGRATRAPLAGARVAVEGTLRDVASVFPVSPEVVTDSSGRFTLAGLPPRFSLEVAAAGHHVRVLSGLRAPAGTEVGPVEIVLTPADPGEETGREFTGVGVTVAPQGDGLVVTSLVAGGGAAAAGVLRGDVILRVDGVPVSTLGFAGAIDAIRGVEGSTVVLTLRREDAAFDLSIDRRIVRG